MIASVAEELSTRNATSGGSSETDVNVPTTKPLG
jgi:hypothetical protein